MTAYRAALAFLVLAFIPGCALAPQPLPKAELQRCLAEGGYASRAPFGTPFCQFKYADAGKSCRGKSDCFGQCLSEAPSDWNSTAVGNLVEGRCEAVHQTFGCHARVQDGRLATPYTCFE